MLSQSGTIVEWGECLPDCPQEDVTAVCVMEPGENPMIQCILKNLTLASAKQSHFLTDSRGPLINVRYNREQYSYMVSCHLEPKNGTLFCSLLA